MPASAAELDVDGIVSTSYLRIMLGDLELDDLPAVEIAPSRRWYALKIGTDDTCVC